MPGLSFKLYQRACVKNQTGMDNFPMEFAYFFLPLHTLEVADELRVGGVVVNEKYTEVLFAV